MIVDVRRWRSGLITVVLAVALAGCSSGSDTTPGPSATPVPFVNAPTAPAPTTKPTDVPKPTATPLAVKVTGRTKAVRRNATASITIRTTPGARCSIRVEYLSGTSAADGLAPKKTGTTGVIQWKWKVGGSTTTGSWPISIDCSLRDRSGGVETQFRVR